MATDRQQKRNVLLKLAAEGMVPMIGGCARALIGGPVGGAAGVTVVRSVEKAINLFGPGIVEKWRGWLAKAGPEERAEAVAELAALPPEAARQQARELLIELAPDAAPQDLSFALDYLSSLPHSLDRALVPDVSGRMSLPHAVTWEDSHSLLQLLPQDIPPYPTSMDLPGTPYRLEELLGSGGFGAVYRASAPTLQHLPLAIKFCLDRSLLPALNLERSNLERLMRAAGERGSGHVVKLYGYDLEHPTPYLVYEYVPGGDLTGYLARHRAEAGRPMTSAEVLGVVTQLAEGLAFAHRAGLVHRDVKPANVLVDGAVLKLADFGLGGVAVRMAVERSRIGVTTIDYLSMAERASLFRGAGTPLYMSPEQRRGANPDPRHDLYSLGVLWFQLLAGDVTRELHPGWAKELAVRFGVPGGHIGLIDLCVGWFDERPKDAGELLMQLRQAAAEPTAVAAVRDASTAYAEPVSRIPTETAHAAVTPSAIKVDTIRKERLLELLRGLQAVSGDPGWPSRRTILLVASVAYVVIFLILIGITATERNTSYSSSPGQAAASGIGAPVSLLLTGAVIIGLRLLRIREWSTRRRRILAALSSEFPAEVEAWGGLQRLQSPAVLAAVLEQVARPEFRVGPGGVQILSPDTVSRPEGIEGRLARFLRPGRHAPPFWVAVILALLLGGLVGVPAAYFVQLQKAPIVVTKYIPTSWGYTETYQYADTSGEPLSADQYSIRRRHVEAVSIVVGVVVGLIVAAAGTWRLTRRRKYLWPTLAAILVGLFVLGLPAAFGTFTFVDWFLGPTRAYPPSRTPEYRSYRGEKLEPFQFAHETRQVAMAGVMVGATVALVLTVALVGIVRWRCHVWERTAQGEEGPEAPTAAPPSPVVTPELLRTDRMGMTVLRSRLLEYARARKSAAMTNIFLAVVTFAIVLPMALMCMGLIGKDVSNTWLAILFVLPVGALIVGSAVMWWVWVRRRHRDRQREMADELIRTFGPVFDQWGGPGFLNNPKTVDEVLAELYRRDQPLG